MQPTNQPVPGNLSRLDKQPANKFRQSLSRKASITRRWFFYFKSRLELDRRNGDLINHLPDPTYQYYENFYVFDFLALPQPRHRPSRKTQHRLVRNRRPESRFRRIREPGAKNSESRCSCHRRNSLQERLLHDRQLLGQPVRYPFGATQPCQRTLRSST